ncbi:tRNA(Ile)-lysidine synthase [Promicromonospora umidemergens]|uniref:tRNA(Ile)-lysidine synthase n=1 Tax=Promicromonospora umidemergens TaxID=629679 RepID=A0ABP8WSF9_9MICO|nr:tRNA lysidine(34) synthetase [Promicromonospora umidemergens]MCP2283547.1 tRNA(Ile)-lysidine synthase [Promicromonospora umidemergens]
MARVDPAVAAARNAVREVLAGLGPDDLVLVACSGGADSLALAASLAFEARRVGRSVRSRGHAVRAGAVVVDHGLQAGSAEVAARAAEQCRSLGLDPVVVRRADRPAAGGPDAAAERRPGLVRDVHDSTGPTSGGGGPEAVARDARYAALEVFAAEAGAALVLLGHTLDDQAEQVLLGLARGAGARSLAGMPRERGIFRRPFLGLRRAQTEAVCAASGLQFWTDPTNLLPTGPPAGALLRDRSGDSRSVHRSTDLGSTDRSQVQRDATDRSRGTFTPLRSQVRGRVLPVLEDTLGPGVAEALGRSADQLRDDADLLDALAAELLERAGRAPAAAQAAQGTGAPGRPTAGESDVVRTLDVAVLEQAHPALRRRALRLAALAAGCRPTDTTTRHVDALDALVVSWSGQGPVHLPGGARARRACGSLFLRAAPTGISDGGTGVPPPSTTQE